MLANEHLKANLFGLWISPHPDSVRTVCAERCSLKRFHMFRIHAPILIVPTAEAREALGRRLRRAGLAAYREIAVAAKGLEIAHLQFASSS